MAIAVDPRLKELKRLTKTLNGALVEHSIRHAIHLERFKAHEVRKILELLEKDVVPDLEEQVATRLANVATRGLEESTFTNVRLKYLLQSTKSILAAGMINLRDNLTDDLHKAAITERDFQAAMVRRLAPVRIDFTLPSVETMRSVVVSRPFQGRLLRQWFSDLGKSTQTKLTKQINIGIVQGESIDQMVRRVRGTKAMGYKDGVIGGLRREVEAVVRTSVQHVTNHARQVTFEENEDVVKGWVFTATLDKQTTAICRALDGKVFKVGEGPVPPRHWG